LFAAAILAATDAPLRERLLAFRARQTELASASSPGGV
jgi:phosphoribosylcarboxyaminoimidazole (NCAIR) mutase